MITVAQTILNYPEHKIQPTRYHLRFIFCITAVVMRDSSIMLLQIGHLRLVIPKGEMSKWSLKAFNKLLTNYFTMSPAWGNEGTS